MIYPEQVIPFPITGSQVSVTDGELIVLSRKNPQQPHELPLKLHLILTLNGI